MTTEAPHTTGLASLDAVLQGVREGDNIVWLIDSLEDYLAVVKPFVAQARRDGRKLIYFRFARHQQLVQPGPGVTVHRVNPSEGFETFINTIRRHIEEAGLGAYYVFDSHSELAREFYSDRMLGNFFLLTCPYLYELKTIAFFGVYRNLHSYHAMQPMVETAQVVLNIYRHHKERYVYPLKADGRYSPTMNMLHHWRGGEMEPVKESPVTAEVLTSLPWPGLPSASYRMVGLWDRRMMRAEETLVAYRRREVSRKSVEQMRDRLLPQIVSNDPHILKLARKYLALADVVYIWKRMIGCGMIGGKSAGMLLARAILRRKSPHLGKLLEAHDSFFIGTDVFYTFMIQNGCWLHRQKQKEVATYLEGLDEVRSRVLGGSFPDYLVHRFSDMLDYFGQSPIIVRSSSLLEDNYGNAFAGKYDSIFCANQGDRQRRLEEFLDAVRRIYASTMSEEALRYRAKRGVLGQDEQMALLVQRVSGQPYGSLFFPHLAGVGFSYNPYVWNEDIDPAAGMMRLVVGLGTRAVDRADDDYTRVVALNAPDKRPEANYGELKKYAQRRVDLLDLKADAFSSRYFVDLMRDCPQLPAPMLGAIDEDAPEPPEGSSIRPWLVSFDRLLAETPFLRDIRLVLKTLRGAYGREVDIEFAANFLSDGSYRLNLLQCRPLQVKIAGALAGRELPACEKDSILLETHGGVVGQSRVIPVDRIIYVAPEIYGRLSESDRYRVARLIGRLTHCGAEAGRSLMLIGPGRWGTRMPSLGVPVTFSEIDTVSVICEVDAMHEGLVPDLSLGTHFFNEMVEMDMLYLAIHTARKGNRLDRDFLRRQPNLLAELLPEEKAWSRAVHVIDCERLNQAAGCPARRFYLNADSITQVGVLYLGAAPVRGGARKKRR